jgi:predicted nucleic acid-binding protein
MKGIADTGFLIAFANRRDAHHDWAVSVAKRITPPLITCEAVLAEAVFHLGNASVVLSMLREGLVAVEFNSAKHLPQLEWLAKRYADRNPDLADLCLIRLSELFPRHVLVTVDRADFRIYRRNRREVIPLISPE